jgi:hypothetical protein
MRSDDFITAAFNGDLSTVQALVAEANESDLKTALANAAQRGHADVVDLLLAKGADVNARLRDGYTSLTMACRGDHWDVAKVLIANRADVNIATGNGYTALIFAASEGQLEIVESLIANGADINAKTVVGTTALLLASMNGHKEVEELLIKAGGKTGLSCDPIPSSNMTPLIRAQAFLTQGKPFEAAECLVEMGSSDAAGPVVELKKIAAISLANMTISTLNSEMEAVSSFRHSVRGQGNSVDYAPITAKEHLAKVSALRNIEMCIRLDPDDTDLTEANKKLRVLVKDSENGLRLNYPSLHSRFCGQ